MISVTAFRREGSFTGICVSGHADSTAGDQYDPVCDAVSVLVISTVNYIESFCAEHYYEDSDETDGRIEFRILDKPTEQTDLLMDFLIFGIRQIIEQYGDRYVSLEEKEE